MKRLGLFPFLVLILVAANAFAQKRGTSTSEERQRVITLTHLLETDPLSEEAIQGRRWLILFLTDVPDISVTICTSPLEPVFKSKKNYSAEIVTQMMFGQAAFVIEHPDKANDARAAYTAGVESALTVYESIIKTKPKARWPYLDDMAAKRRTDGWQDYVQSLVDKCGKK